MYHMAISSLEKKVGQTDTRNVTRITISPSRRQCPFYTSEEGNWRTSQDC
jgi:hypothetical protein